jgi:hypothetical protein
MLLRAELSAAGNLRLPNHAARITLRFVRFWLVIAVAIVSCIACGGDIQSAGTGTTQQLADQGQTKDESAAATPTPEPPYLQLNVEPFLAVSNPFEARVGVVGSGENIGTVRSALVFDPTTVFVAAVDGKPDCEAAELGTIASELTFLPPRSSSSVGEFTFLPPGCSATDCQAVRAVVTAADPDFWGLLYSCRVFGRGTTRISVTGQASSPDGVPAGVVTEGQTFFWSGPVQLFASGAIDPSTLQGEVTISMDAGDNIVAGLQYDLNLDGLNATFLRNSDGLPDCWVNPAINKPATRAGFLPQNCVGEHCSRIRIIVFSVLDTSPVPTGEWLYRCRVTADGMTTVRFSNALAAGPLDELILATGASSTLGATAMSADTTE